MTHIVTPAVAAVSQIVGGMKNGSASLAQAAAQVFFSLRGLGQVHGVKEKPRPGVGTGTTYARLECELGIDAVASELIKQARLRMHGSHEIVARRQSADDCFRAVGLRM